MSGLSEPLLERRGRLPDFLLQAGANALGTVISGVLLGGVAVRAGLLDVDDDQQLYTAATYAQVAGAIIGVLSSLALVTLLLLAWIEPHRRARHRTLLFRALEVAALLGVVASSVFWAALMLAYWDPEGLIIWVATTASLLCLIVVLRALRRRFGSA